jgi:hypothetical protein
MISSHQFPSDLRRFAMVKASEPSGKNRWISADAIYAAGVLIWIVSVWAGAFYTAREAIADESAGMGGNGFLLACSLATAALITVFSAREFLFAYRRLSGN